MRGERLPHIWCQGCGLGTALTTFISALQWLEKNEGWDLDKVAVVSGIGCTGRIAGYIRLDSFHTTHGRAIPFATGLKLANPELKVVVLSRATATSPASAAITLSTPPGGIWTSPSSA